MTSHEPGGPAGFSRPDGWQPLGEPGSSLPDAGQGDPQPDAAPPQSAPAEQGSGATGLAERHGLRGPRHPLRLLGWITLLLVTAILVVTALQRRAPVAQPDLVPNLHPPTGAPSIGFDSPGDVPYPPAPMPSGALVPSPPAVTPLPHDWHVRAQALRPDLQSPEIVFAPDNAPDDDHAVLAGGRVWVVMTGEGIKGVQTKAVDAHIRIHGLDPATGRQLWQQDLPSGLCARQLLDGRLACLAAVERDDQTGLPRRWEARLVDPVTGAVRVRSSVEGWFTMAVVHGRELLLVEQGQPAPHLAVRSLDASLRPRWVRDLSGEPRVADMFSENRMVTRQDLAVPQGLALEAVRPRMVGRMLALWGRSTTLFVGLDDGSLRDARRCSPMVDDGRSVWCGDGDSVVALDHELHPRFAPVQGTRLLMGRDDPRHTGGSTAWFTDADGRLQRVDPLTGEVQGELLRTGTPAGLAVQSWQAGRTSIIDDAGGIVALDAVGRDPLWAARHHNVLDAVLTHHGRVVICSDGFVDLVDPATGRVVARHDQLRGFSLQAAGSLEQDALVMVGLDGVSRLRLE